jgi:ABC-2 type transport system ATP-binding protein
MKNLCDEGGSVFFSTHVLEVAEKICDHVAIIKNGKILASGKMDEVIGNQSLEDVFFEIALKKEEINE